MTYHQGRLERLEERLSATKTKARHAADKHMVTRQGARAFSFVGMAIQKVLMVVVNNLALTVVYFVGVGATHLFVRATKKDIGFSPGKQTSWRAFESRDDKKSYLRQF